MFISHIIDITSCYAIIIFDRIDFLYFSGKVAGSAAISLLLIFITEMLFLRKGKYRTNAA
jgi:hypothetical protein